MRVLSHKHMQLVVVDILQDEIALDWPIHSFELRWRMHLLDCRCPFHSSEQLMSYCSFLRARRADRRPAGVMTVPDFSLIGVPLLEILADFSGDLNVTSAFDSPFFWVTPKIMAMMRITACITRKDEMNGGKSWASCCWQKQLECCEYKVAMTYRCNADRHLKTYLQFCEREECHRGILLRCPSSWHDLTTWMNWSRSDASWLMVSDPLSRHCLWKGSFRPIGSSKLKRSRWKRRCRKDWETGPWAYKRRGKVMFQLDVDPWDLW